MNLEYFVDVPPRNLTHGPREPRPTPRQNRAAARENPEEHAERIERERLRLAGDRAAQQAAWEAGGTLQEGLQAGADFRDSVRGDRQADVDAVEEAAARAALDAQFDAILAEAYEDYGIGANTVSTKNFGNQRRADFNPYLQAHRAATAEIATKRDSGREAAFADIAERRRAQEAYENERLAEFNQGHRARDRQFFRENIGQGIFAGLGAMLAGAQGQDVEASIASSAFGRNLARTQDSQQRLFDSQHQARQLDFDNQMSLKLRDLDAKIEDLMGLRDVQFTTNAGATRDFVGALNQANLGSAMANLQGGIQGRLQAQGHREALRQIRAQGAENERFARATSGAVTNWWRDLGNN